MQCSSAFMDRSPYKSPTDMGELTWPENCIRDDAAWWDTSCQEIIRRYYDARRRALAGKCSEEEVYKIEMLMNRAGILVHDRPVVDVALSRCRRNRSSCCCIKFADSHMITGKTTDLLGPCAVPFKCALKELAGIPHSQPVISPAAIEPIQTLKHNILKQKTHVCIWTKC